MHLIHSHPLASVFWHPCLARFTREAQTLAALNHPNIAQIYGLEPAPSGSAQALVMELVEGEDLSTVIERGPLGGEASAKAARARWSDRWRARPCTRIPAGSCTRVRAFPEPGRRVQVSQQGASEAWWTSDGRQLLFLGDDLHSLWRVDVEPGAAMRLGTPRQIATFPPNIVSMDATPDRKRFLAIAPERTGPGSVTIVQNWLASLK